MATKDDEKYVGWLVIGLIGVILWCVFHIAGKNTKISDCSSALVEANERISLAQSEIEELKTPIGRSYDDFVNDIDYMSTPEPVSNECIAN